MPTPYQYIVQKEDGEEIGPFNQETLIELTKQGKITILCNVRNKLLPQWENAGHVAFLKPLLKEKIEAIAHPKLTLWEKIKKKTTRRCDYITRIKEVQNTKFHKAKLYLRILAGLTDIITLGILFILASAATFACVKAKLLTAESAGTDLLAFCVLLYFFYYIIMISLFTQTVGQKMWGIFLMRGEDDIPFYAGRIFFYALFLPFFALITPITAQTNSGHRSWQEYFTDLSLVKMKQFKQSDK
ncbi:MAG: RDD family protein [Lentisphaeria bacterium]